MSKFRWLGRDRFIQKCSIRTINNFHSTQQHLAECGLPKEKFNIDLDGIFDFFLADFSVNPEWIGHISVNSAKYDIVTEVFEYVRMKKFSQSENLNLLGEWAKEELRKLQ